jgi:hypothetical protein
MLGDPIVRGVRAQRASQHTGRKGRVSLQICRGARVSCVRQPIAAAIRDLYGKHRQNALFAFDISYLALSCAVFALWAWGVSIMRSHGVPCNRHQCLILKARQCYTCNV